MVDDGRGRCEQHARRGDFDFDATWQAVGPDDILTLIYTSGTTGPPKGVQLTHVNLIAAVQGYDQMIEFPGDGRVVSWLPMAHIAERACSHYLPIVLGFTTTCCPDPRQVVAYLPEVRPTLVLRGAAHLGEAEGRDRGGRGGRAGPGAQAGHRVGARRGAAQGARGAGRRGRPGRAGRGVRKADGLVLSKMRERLGLDQVESVNVGAAPTPREVIEFFHAIGVPLAELWGMSETCGYGACNPPDKIKIGTVGPPAPGRRDQAGRGRRGADPRADRHAGLPQPARQDE